MKVLVTGVTRTGNLGGAAMLCAVEDTIGDKVDDFALASILPARDCAQRGPDHARIVKAGYHYWLLVAAPLCILLWPLRSLSMVRKLMSRLPLLGDMGKADAVVDLSGIAFVDGRGLPLLYYNFALVLPALFFGVPVYKLSQAVGPFRTRMNAVVARWTLRRCAVVVARGKISLAHLKTLGIGSGRFLQDTSFALVVPDTVRDRGRDAVESVCAGNGPFVVYSPSAVVKRHCEKIGLDMVAIAADALASLAAQGVRIALLPHSTDTGIRKNNDYSVAREIVDAMSRRGTSIALLDARGDPRLARAMIACADVFIASRFHSMIAALSQAVPVVTIGWSHKYAEAAEPFGMDRFTIDYAQMDAARLNTLVQDLLREREALVPGLRQASDEARRSAVEGIQLVLEAERPR